MLNIENELKKIICKITKKSINDLDEINEETDLVMDLNFDSIEMVQLIVDLEVNFGIEIDMEDIEVEVLSKYKLLKDLIISKVN